MSELIEVGTTTAVPGEVDLLAVSCFEDDRPDWRRLPEASRSALQRLRDRPGWRGDTKQIRYGATPDGDGVVGLYGLGVRKQFGLRELRAWLAGLTREADKQGYERLAVVLPDHPSGRGEASARWICRELALGGYRFDRYREKPRAARLRAVTLLVSEADRSDFESALTEARAVAAGVALARDLGNTPPNIATPIWMAEQAQSLAQSRNMGVRVLGEKEMSEMGMGGILAVGAGSANPSRLVCLEWGEGERSVSLVGKGITFDTGGISIKPAKAMDEMKYDKCGACTVLGIAQAAADLRVPVRLKAYMALAENMLGDKAYRPSDIVKCYNGKTVEVLNTDAEGRMVLADAMSWAASDRPDTLVEMSTLTGACLVALGAGGAGLFTPDDALAASLLGEADAAGERLWRLPLWEEFGEQMKGTHADLQNLGGPWGGANTAAAFLSNFVEGAGSWAHLDIAGPSARGADQEGLRGATGFGVATVTGWLRRQGA